MNKERRKRIDEIIDQLNDIKDEIGSVLEEEQEAFDNMPESFQDGERGEAAQVSIDALENANSSAEETTDNLGEALGD